MEVLWLGPKAEPCEIEGREGVDSMTDLSEKVHLETYSLETVCPYNIQAEKHIYEQ